MKVWFQNRRAKFRKHERHKGSSNKSNKNNQHSNKPEYSMFMNNQLNIFDSFIENFFLR